MHLLRAVCSIGGLQNNYVRLLATPTRRTYATMSSAIYDLDEILRVASDAAKAAGTLMRARAGVTVVDKTKASSQDLVTEIDRQCQQIIEDAVTSNFPSHHMLGEESVPAGADASARAIQEALSKEWLWVVDPIDGTTNFVQGIPCSVVSIGVAHNAEVVVGVIYEPYRDELYTAVRGKGSKLNGVPIHVSPETSIKNAVYGFGTHHTKHVCPADRGSLSARQ
jgi:myo-inositol-1(or 4)-monophosphatase